MRRFVSHAWVSIATYAICVYVGPHPLWAAPFVVSAAVLTWVVGSYAADWQYRHITDTDSLNQGMCPVCTSERLIEVTSGRDPEGQRRVVCTGCGNAFAIIAEGDDFVTERLGKRKPL